MWCDEMRRIITDEEIKNKARRDLCAEESKKKLKEIVDIYNNDVKKSLPENLKKSEEVREALLEVPPKEKIWVRFTSCTVV